MSLNLIKDKDIIEKNIKELKANIKEKNKAIFKDNISIEPLSDKILDKYDSKQYSDIFDEYKKNFIININDAIYYDFCINFNLQENDVLKNNNRKMNNFLKKMPYIKNKNYIKDNIKYIKEDMKRNPMHNDYKYGILDNNNNLTLRNENQILPIPNILNFNDDKLVIEQLKYIYTQNPLIKNQCNHECKEQEFYFKNYINCIILEYKLDIYEKLLQVLSNKNI